MLGLIIFGTRGITYKHKYGEFHCPECQRKRDYDLKRVRCFFTLYFIPVIPMHLLGEYVECASCRATYKLDVLDYDSAGETVEMEAEFHKAIKRVMVDMMIADGVIDDDELEILHDIHEKVTGKKLGPKALQREIERAEKGGADALRYLKDIRGYLNPDGKVLVMQAALAVAAADGEFQEEEQALLLAMAKAIGMPTQEIKAIIKEGPQ